ncbi:hypothetical protein J1N35_006973 [Gossypium stocksii]|uniref:Uncharacterized protein n=1 Tax=Gossypium stocksii TaxID=47602 RepID=A0A9D4AF64_9ROSI|nr:hypothetical protein J1N35_006973 [Gossypium stocksii]
MVKFVRDAIRSAKPITQDMTSRLISLSIKSEEFVCSTSLEKIRKLLARREITYFDNFKYNFEILMGKHRLSEMQTCKGKNSRVLLPLYVFEASFRLHLHFFFEMLSCCRAATRQLIGSSWWTLMLHGEATSVNVFRRTYKVIPSSETTQKGFVYLLLKKEIKSSLILPPII